MIVFDLTEIRVVRGVGRTPRGLRAQQITSHAAGGTSRFVAPNHGRRAIKKGSTQMQDATSHQAPKPLRPTDQEERSVAPTQTGERSDGRPQSQLKNPSRHSPSSSPRPTSKGARRKWAHKATASKLPKSISKGESKRAPTTHALQRVEVSISGNLEVGFFG